MSLGCSKRKATSQDVDSESRKRRKICSTNDAENCRFIQDESSWKHPWSLCVNGLYPWHSHRGLFLFVNPSSILNLDSLFTNKLFLFSLVQWQPQLLQNSDSNKTTNILNLLLYLFHLLQLQCLESGNTTSSRASTGQMFEKPFLVTSSNRSEERELTHLLIII